MGRLCSQGEIKTTDKRKIGSSYEQIAAAYLANKGYIMLDQNYRGRQRTEIDLIALDRDCLVFAEVKFRSGSRMGDPAEAVHLEKQQRIRSAARQYLWEHPEYRQFPCRFDVVAILGSEIRLIRDAF